MEMKILLDENEVPKNYYNIAPDLPRPLEPPLDPATKKPLNPSALEAIFSKELVRQEISQERFLAIPAEVREALLRMGRPSPLFRAKRLEEKLGTPAKIFFKHEGLNPCGSHKLNTAIPQAFFNAREGVEKLATETGAGQWGTALAYACMMYGMGCEVFMVKATYDQKPMRRSLIETYGGEVHCSPSIRTEFGRKLLSKSPDHPGSLGVAISEAIETVVSDPEHRTKYALGSVLNSVLMHQSVIGQEVSAQLAKADEKPDFVIGCVGGGSNFAGIAFPLYYDKLKGKNNAEFIAVEPASCASMTNGKYGYDFGDTAGMTPLLKMHSLGREFVPDPIYAGGLRYHGMAPSVSLLVDEGAMKAEAYAEKEVFDAAVLFARSEGVIAAPESAHAIKCAVEKALECKKKNEEKTIVFNLSGHGILDLGGYQKFLEGKM